MSDFFDPDAIRGDVESHLTGIFYPKVYSAATPYAVGDRARLNGNVYVAKNPVTGLTPPSANWDEDGPAYKVIYENVGTTLAESGAIRLAISWAGTQDESIGCTEGTLRLITGVLTCWIFTPRNAGTSQGLKAATRLRRSLLDWNRIGTCGKGVQFHNPNGPRSATVPTGADYYAHIVAVTLRTMERVSYLR